jgi:glutaredoxin 2
MAEPTEKVEIVLSKEQYKTLLKLLYIVDYLLDRGSISEFRTPGSRNEACDLLKQIYEYSDRLNLPKSLSLATLTSETRFTDEEQIKLLQQFESDLRNVAQGILASDFAKRDLKRMLDAIGDNDFESTLLKRKLVSRRAAVYEKEFESNGADNLRFKMFHKIGSSTKDS